MEPRMEPGRERESVCLSSLLNRHPAPFAPTPFDRTCTAAQLGYDQSSLQRYPPAHLRAPVLAIVEEDRNLLDAETGTQRAVGQLDLEGVAARAHARQVDGLEDLGSKALEPAREIADVDPEHLAGIPATASARDSAQHAPGSDLAAGDVA